MSSSEEHAERMRSLLETIVHELVDLPDDVSVHVTLSEGGAVCALTVKFTEAGKSEVGKVIGKKGRNADAMRALLESVATKFRMRTMLDIADSHSGQRQRRRHHAAG